ncbi:unnamed protein product [Trichobilharzia szidati]|nr:unnamed protein product [Trichobilharzia szidati]
MKRMNHYNEYEEPNELSIIIRGQDIQRNNGPTRPRSQSPSNSDVTTIDENDVACEIEIPHQPLEDHWVEDCYATVVRHTPTSTNASTSTDHPTTIFIHNNNNNNNSNNNSNNNNNSNSNNITNCTIKKEADTSIQDDLDIYSPRKEYTKKSVDSRIPSRESIEQPRCHTCREIVYPLEALQTIGRVYHKSCFKCHQCQRVLTLGKYSVWEGNPYCEPHYLVLFKSFGHYDGTAPKTSSTTYDATSHNRRSDSPIPAEERPSGHVTQALVAKFQGLETGNKVNGGGSTQSYSTQNQLSRIVLNPSQPAATNAHSDVFPSSGRARQLVERWNKMPNEKKIVGGRTSPVLNGKSHVSNAAYKLPTVEPKPLVRKTLEQPRPLVSELKQNFNHKPEDEAYSSAESTESGKLTNVYRTIDSKQNEFPTPGITPIVQSKRYCCATTAIQKFVQNILNSSQSAELLSSAINQTVEQDPVISSTSNKISQLTYTIDRLSDQESLLRTRLDLLQ